MTRIVRTYRASRWIAYAATVYFAPQRHFTASPSLLGAGIPQMP